MFRKQVQHGCMRVERAQGVIASRACLLNVEQQGNVPPEWMKQRQSLWSDLTEEGTETA